MPVAASYSIGTTPAVCPLRPSKSTSPSPSSTADEPRRDQTASRTGAGQDEIGGSFAALTTYPCIILISITVKWGRAGVIQSTGWTVGANPGEGCGQMRPLPSLICATAPSPSSAARASNPGRPAKPSPQSRPPPGAPFSQPELNDPVGRSRRASCETGLSDTVRWYIDNWWWVPP
jgi:hypothetical protein